MKIEGMLQNNTSPLQRDNLEWNRKEVNNLKHQLFGHRLFDAKTRPLVSDLENAFAAVDQLLGMLEQPDVLPQLSSAYRSLPPE